MSRTLSGAFAIMKVMMKTILQWYVPLPISVHPQGVPR